VTDRPFAHLTDKELRAKRRALPAGDPQRPALEAERELRRQVSGYFWRMVALAVTLIVSFIATVINVILYFRG
jgi:hypothetical protein